MSHRHFCDFAGHYWNCDGTATRIFAPEVSVCMCLTHGVPMEEGDHSECSIELLSCPEHRDDQLRAMGYEPGDMSELPLPVESEKSQMFTDKDGNPTIGFCLWCGEDFYTMDEVEAHNADDMRECPVYQQSKDELCMPPALQWMIEQAEELKNKEEE